MSEYLQCFINQCYPHFNYYDSALIYYNPSAAYILQAMQIVEFRIH